MWQIKVNGILMPEIFYSLRAAMEACQREKAEVALLLQKLSWYSQLRV